MSVISDMFKDESLVPQGEPVRGLERLLGKAWDALAPEVARGAQELSKALLGDHDAYVLYGREGKEQESNLGHGLPAEANIEPKQKEMDGREM